MTSPPPMSEQAGTIEVELLGVARLLAKQARVTLAVPAAPRLRDAARALATALPALVGSVVGSDGALLGGHAFCRGRVEMLTDPDATLNPGEELLLITLVAGGSVAASAAV